MTGYEIEPLDYTIGLDNLSKLIESTSKSNWKWSEQDTRFQFINEFLTYCLGWKKGEIRTEQSQDGKYTDYELGSPRCCVVEAKKDSINFNFPSSGRKKTICSLKSLISCCPNAKAAVEQVFTYCTNRGVDIAIIINGYQIIAFVASRRDGIAPMEGDAFIIRDKQNMIDNFMQTWQYLSVYGVRDRVLYDHLTKGEKVYLPPKISSYVTKYADFRYKNDNQKDLETLSQLLIHDIITSKEVELDFYSSCYCQSDSLSQDACISKRILESRYAGLFPPSEVNVTVNKLVKEKGKKIISEDIIAESMSKRPIVVIGDVGVGKTSFLRGLPYLQAKEEFKKSIYLYIDLGTGGTLVEDLKLFILQQVEGQLLMDYNVNIYDNKFIRGVFHKEVELFKTGLYGKYAETNKEKYEEKLIEELENLVSNKSNYLNKVINHLARGHRKQIIITIDNADQRDIKTQDAAFLIAQEFAASWSSLVFIALRPETFYSSTRRGGAISGYSPRVFTISPPQLDVVIQKRLGFALKVARGEVEAARLSAISLNLGNIVTFMEAIQYAISNNKDIRKMLSSITGGNVRLAVDFIAKFMSNSNVNSDKIIEKFNIEKKYLIPLHEFSKAAILGDYSYFHEDTSLAMNIFDISSTDEKEHFLSAMVVSFLASKHSRKDKDSFVSYSEIMNEMQTHSFISKQVDYALMRLTNKQLIESIGRVKFERKNGVLQGNMPSGFRVTSIGVYHILKWISEFSYLDAVSLDTPILDEKVRNGISDLKDSFTIANRYSRTLLFRHYLTIAWDNVKLNTTYFNWKESLKIGSLSFDKVEQAIKNNAENQED